MDYKKNKEYFDDNSISSGVVLIIIGVIVCLSSGGINTGLFVGISFIFFGIIGIFAVVSHMSDSQYDASVRPVSTVLRNRALEKLGIDADEVNEIEPIIFHGYEYSGKEGILVKQGKDEKWRSNLYKAVSLFFSANEVHCYTLNYYTTEPKETEETDVYFYKDIVSISTGSEMVEGRSFSREYFKLITAGGSSLVVSLSDTKNAQRSINGMRSLIKLKKQENA